MKRIVASMLLFLAEGLEQKRMPVGGQAVIEGVLMKGPDRWGLSVRKPDGEIENETWQSFSRTKRMPWKLPIVRGVVTMVEMMTIGFRALNKSAQIAIGEEEKITPKEFLLSVVVAIGAVVGLFIALPLWLSDLAVTSWGLTQTGKNILEGSVRGLVFIAYVGGIGLWSEIRQVFRYHGAEHKTINAFESGAEMTPENIRNFFPYSSAMRHLFPPHRRCGEHRGFLHRGKRLHPLENRQQNHPSSLGNGNLLRDHQRSLLRRSPRQNSHGSGNVLPVPHDAGAGRETDRSRPDVP